MEIRDTLAHKSGNGSRTVAIFSDVDCAPCRTMHREIEKLDDTTVYVSVYPLLSGGQNRAPLEHIRCAPDGKIQYGGQAGEEPARWIAANQTAR